MIKKNKKYKLHILAFFTLFLFIFLFLNSLISPYQPHFSTWELVASNNPPEILFMGSSHANKSFVPVMIDEALGVNCAVLSSNNQYMQMTTANLKCVLKEYTPKVVVLEAYTPFINTKETIAPSEVYKNSDGVKNLLHRFSLLCACSKLEDIPAGMFPLLRSYERWDRFSYKEKVQESENIYAQGDIKGFLFGITTHAKGTLKTEDIENYYKNSYAYEGYEKTLTKENKKALKEFLLLCEKNNIQVWIVKTPTTLKLFDGRMKELKDFAKDYACVRYIDDYHTYLQEMKLTASDFYDPTHLSRSGAVKFTEYFISKAAPLLEKEIDFENVFFYKGESIKKLSQTTYRYSLEAYGTDNLYKFEYKKQDGTYKTLREYSTKNYIDLAVAPCDAAKIRVSVKKSTMNEQEVKTKGLFINFSTENSAVL